MRKTDSGGQCGAMCKVSPSGIACFLLVLISAPRYSALRAQEDLPAGKQWKLVWSDEFNGTSLDETKWTRAGPYRVFDGWIVKDAVYVDGKGHLVIKTFRKDGRYCGGMVSTKGKFEHKYGYWVARCKMPTQVGHFPAFWIWSSALQPAAPEAKTGGLECGTEIDIIEYLARTPDIVYHTLHYLIDGKRKSRGEKVRVPGISTGFHTIAVEWTPREYIFYVDGKVTWRTTEAVSHREEFACLSDRVGKWAGDIREAELPDFFIVDYVRIYDVPEKPVSP